MSFEERMEENKSYKSFRTSLDLGMGIFYILIGAFVIYAKYFGTMELPGTYAYILGSLMILYGIFRVYRGLAVVMRKRDNVNSSRL